MVTREYPSYYPSESRRFSRTVPPSHQAPYQLAYPDRRYQLPTHDTTLTRQTMTEDNEGAPTRKRIAVACGRCRKRKIRCSGDPGHGQPCTNCKSAGAEPCLFLRVSSTETPLRADPSASFTYSVDTARRFHSGPPMAYDPSDLSPHTVPDMTGYRNYYPRPSADQQSSYYGVPGPATTWGSSMPSTYSDETGSGVGVDYSGMQAQYNSPMMPLYASPSPSRWAGSRASGSQVYATDTTYSPVYQTATSSSSSDASGMTAMAPFPGMGRMAASLPTPPALVDGTKMGAMLPTPASSSRNPLPSSPSTYRMPSSVHMSEGLPPSSSPVESGNSATYYEYPPQASNLGSAGTPVSATRSTLPGNGSTLSITSSTASATDPGLYSSGQGSTRDDAYGPSHQGLQIFRHDQDLKSQGSNENMSYMYSGGGGGDTGSGYYSPASVEVPGTAGSSAERDSSRVGLRA